MKKKQREKAVRIMVIVVLVFFVLSLVPALYYFNK